MTMSTPSASNLPDYAPVPSASLGPVTTATRRSTLATNTSARLRLLALTSDSRALSNALSREAPTGTALRSLRRCAMHRSGGGMRARSRRGEGPDGPIPAPPAQDR
jgi:hypothetical protein